MRFSLGFFCLMFASCTSAGGSLPDQDPAALTPSQLNASPQRYDGRVIKVRGFLLDETEDFAIWDQQSDIADKNVGLSHCISVLYPAEMKTAVHRLNRRFVEVSGTFDKDVVRDGIIRLGLCNRSAIRLLPPEYPVAVRPLSATS